MDKVYCVSVRGEIRDVSNTERGAKNFATRNGFFEVYSRSNRGCYVVEKVAFRVGSRWRKAARSLKN